jgi:hypothetical protein
VEHYHIRSVAISLDALTSPDSPAYAAFTELLKHPDRTKVFQTAMSRLARPSEQHQTQASLPVAWTHLTVLDGVTGLVQQSDGSRTNVTARYVIEEVELPIIELLAVNEALVVTPVNAVLASDGGSVDRAFVPAALKAAGRTDDLALLSYCESCLEPRPLSGTSSA